MNHAKQSYPDTKRAKICWRNGVFFQPFKSKLVNKGKVHIKSYSKQVRHVH